MNYRGVGTLLVLWFVVCALKGAAFYGLNWFAAVGTDVPLLPWQAWTALMAGHAIFQLKPYVPEFVQADFE